MLITVAWLQGLQVWSAEGATTRFDFWGPLARIQTVWLWAHPHCATATWFSFATRLDLQKICLQLHALSRSIVSQSDCAAGYGEAETTRLYRPWRFQYSRSSVRRCDLMHCPVLLALPYLHLRYSKSAITLWAFVFWWNCMSSVPCPSVPMIFMLFFEKLTWTVSFPHFTRMLRSMRAHLQKLRHPHTLLCNVCRHIFWVSLVLWTCSSCFSGVAQLYGTGLAYLTEKPIFFVSCSAPLAPYAALNLFNVTGDNLYSPRAA